MNQRLKFGQILFMAWFATEWSEFGCAQLPPNPPSNQTYDIPKLDLDTFIPFGITPNQLGPGSGMAQPLPPVPPTQFEQPKEAAPSITPQRTGSGSLPIIDHSQGNRLAPLPPPSQGVLPPTLNEAARWRFSFHRAPWESVIRSFAQDLGFSLMITSVPPGEFSYFDSRTYSVQEAIDILNDHLIPLGYLLIRNQSKLTLTSAQQGFAEGVIPFVSMRDASNLGRNEMATIAFPIKSQSQQSILTEIQLLMSSLGAARLLSNSNRLIVTDTGAYLVRIRDLLGGYGLAAGEQETIVVSLKNTRAESIAMTLNERTADWNPVRTAAASNGAQGGGGPVSAIKETNSLLISGTPEELSRLQALIAEIDRPPAQVVIQGLLVEVNLGNTKELGAELGLQDSVLFDRSVVDNLVTLSQTSTAPNGVQTSNQNVVSQTAAPGFAFNNAALGNNVAVSPNTIGSQGLSNLGVGRISGDLGFGGMVLSASSNSVSILLRALAAKFKLEILSRPQIRTIDNSEALIQIGQQVPVIDGVTVTPVGSANPVIRQDRAGIILKVTPHVSPDGLVQIKVEAEKSAFRLAPGSGVPVFADAKNGNVIQAPIKDLTTAQTTVSARAGQTIVLGGMITNEDSVIERKVPFLGDIPLLGRLFRYDRNSTARKELLIFLTPQIILCDADSDAFKNVEIDRIQMNHEKITQMHGPLLAPSAEGPVPTGSENLLSVP